MMYTGIILSHVVAHVNTAGCVFIHDAASTDIYTLSLHDALPILTAEGATPRGSLLRSTTREPATPSSEPRSEEHTSELQSLRQLVCRLLLEKKKDNYHIPLCIMTTPRVVPDAEQHESHHTFSVHQ